MKLGTFVKDGDTRLGAFEDGFVIDLAAGGTVPGDMIAFIEAGAGALAEAAKIVDEAKECGLSSAPGVYPLSAIKFAAPLRPPKIVCTGTNYEDYRKLIGIPYAPVPLIFLKSSSSVIGHDEAIQLPNGYGIFYHEWEFSCVISERCRGVAAEDVNDVIFGYTIVNDITGRSLEATNRELQPLGKNMDTFAPIGPWIVTPDAMPADIYNLRTLRRRNGEIECDSNTSNMRLGFGEIVSYASNFFTLEPGDVITTATPPAGAFYPGDVVEAEIEGIGVLRNPVEGVDVDLRYARDLDVKDIV